MPMDIPLAVFAIRRTDRIKSKKRRLPLQPFFGVMSLCESGKQKNTAVLEDPIFRQVLL